MKKLILLLIFCSIISTFSQTPDSNLHKWIPKGIVGLNFSSISFDNWTQGGDDALTYSLNGNFGVDYKTSNWEFLNNLKLVYGQTKIGSGEFKTNDNELYLESIFKLRLSWIVEPFFSNIIRTTIANGYKYDKDTIIPIATFFDPAYVTQSLGFSYGHLKFFKIRIGVAAQEIFTNKYNQYSDDPKTTEVEKFKFETGIESVADIDYTLMENIRLKSQLRLFSAFHRLDVWDVRWDNTITAQVNKYIVVNFNILFVYEQAQSLHTQLKKVFQVGLTYSLF